MQFDDLKDDYERLWETMEPKPSMAKSVDYYATKIVAGRPRYEAVSEKTGVPWFMIGLMHMMEAGCDFSKHLHNGDPLTKKTVNVPKGRPASKGPWTWEESAVDAIVYDKLDKVTDWSLPRIAYCMEAFNGWGYRKYHPEVANPYLWSGCTHYARGKYVEDPPGSKTRWVPDLESKQAGSMPVLRRLCSLVPEIGFASSVPPPKKAEPPALVTPDSFRKAEPAPVRTAAQSSTTIFAGLTALFGALVQYLEHAVAVGMDSIAELTKLEPLKVLSPNTKAIGMGLTVAAVVLVIGRRLQAAKQGKVG